MIVVCRNKMVSMGVCEACDEIEVNIEEMSNTLLNVIRSQPNWDQVELTLHMRTLGWEEIDFNFCLSLLRRKNKIVLMSD